MAKIRLDVYLAEKGFASSREKARAMINDGLVYIDNKKCEKPGQQVDVNTVKPEIRGETLKYVSRGGLKLEKAIKEFKLDLNGKCAMDIGASTGGFTDCMLQNGAKKVYAVDVGRDQLAEKLKNNECVINMERTDIRNITEEMIKDKIDFASVDVSFISLTLVLPQVKKFLKNDGELAVLIKPQFEAGKEHIGKKGVVRDKKVHCAVTEKIVIFTEKNGFCPLGLSFSPVKGPEGNIEYLLYLKNTEGVGRVKKDDIIRIVNQSHDILEKNKK